MDSITDLRGVDVVTLLQHFIFVPRTPLSKEELGGGDAAGSSSDSKKSRRRRKLKKSGNSDGVRCSSASGARPHH